MDSELIAVAPAEWQRLPIKAICRKVTSGGTPSRARTDFYTDGKWGWVKTKELKDGWIDQTEESITDEALVSSSAKLLPPNTILLALYGATVGQLGILRHVMTCNQACCAMIVDPKKADFRFLFYQLRFSRSQLKSLATGAAQQNLSGQLIKSYKLPFPSLRDQQAISCILGALDDKIDLNRQMSLTLEAIARAIFKSWFVDFDPLYTKTGGQQPPRLKPQIVALFPDQVKDSVLGPIPQGWRVQSLPEVCEVNPPRSLSKGTLAPYLDMANMPTQGASPEFWKMREMGSGMKFINGDTLVARITPCLENGKTAFVDFLNDGQVGWGSTEYIVLRPRGIIPPVFSYLLARSDGFRSFAIQQMTGSSGRQRVPAASLEKYQIVTPNIESPLYQNFGDIVSPMFDRIRAAMLQSRTLAAFRDTLIPKLISGELRVPDAERIVGRCI